MKLPALLIILVAITGLMVTLNTRLSAPSVSIDASPASASTFAAGFLEHLDRVQLAADALVDLGERRERNLLVVGQRQSAMNTALDSTDAWLAQQTAHRDDPAVSAYSSGAAEIRRAMTQAQSAFLRFDWNGIAAANDALKHGAADISVAKDLLAPFDGT